jgi:hypothetical protein
MKPAIRKIELTFLPKMEYFAVNKPDRKEDLHIFNYSSDDDSGLFIFV